MKLPPSSTGAWNWIERERRCERPEKIRKRVPEKKNQACQLHFLLLNAILALNAGTAREIPGCPPVRVVPHRNEKRAYMKLFYDTSFLLSYPSGIPVYTVSLLNALAALDQTLTIHSGTTSMDLRHHLKLRKLERQYCPEVKITRHMKLFPKAFFSSGMFESAFVS